MEPQMNAQRRKARPGQGFLAMARVGVHMLLHDRLKLFATVIGVVFAVVLSNQQLATLRGLLDKNTMLVRRAGADVWIAPPSTEILQPGELLPDSVLAVARETPGVAWAAPLLLAGGSVRLPSGGSEAVTLVGAELPALHGGPWNVVAGEPRDLGRPDALFFEDSEREKLGGINLGSVREVNGHRVQAVGFTVGLIPFGPSYAFGSWETVRELSHTANHLASLVMIGVAPGADPAGVVAAVSARLPDLRVMTRAQAEQRTVRYLLTTTSLGMTVGSGAFFAVLVGFIIVSLTMFSAVVDHLREFGTLKAIGATNLDLAKLLLAQALFIAGIGWLAGQSLIVLIIGAISSPRLPLSLPPSLMAVTLGGVILLCVFASSLGLVRLRKLEPAMVFRG